MAWPRLTSSRFHCSWIVTDSSHTDEIWRHKHILCLVIAEACTIQLPDYLPLNPDSSRAGVFTQISSTGFSLMVGSFSSLILVFAGV